MDFGSLVIGSGWVHTRSFARDPTVPLMLVVAFLRRDSPCGFRFASFQLVLVEVCRFDIMVLHGPTNYEDHQFFIKVGLVSPFCFKPQ